MDRSANGYQLTRTWFNFAFENQDRVSPTHTAMFCWLVELNNRMGWAEKFASPASQTMAAIGCKSYNTYKKVFNDLIEFGFVNLVKESKNQWTACIIALSNFDEANNNALDKALIKQVPMQSKSTHQSTDSIIKPVNKETTKPKNQETLTPDPAVADPDCAPDGDNISFKKFWDLYDKKVGKIDKIQKKWDKLKPAVQLAIIAHIPKYIASQPEKQYRKNPETYLNNQAWLDEIVSTEKSDSNSFPNFWSSEIENKLSNEQVPQYWKHLRSLGLMPIKNKMGYTLKWE